MAPIGNMAVKDATKKYFVNWSSQIKEDLKVEKSKSDENENSTWSNQDLDPTPAHKRTWQWHNYLLYFVGTGFNNWQGGSAAIGVGLGWQAAIAVAFITQTISGIMQSLNSKAAARYHLGFPASKSTHLQSPSTLQAMYAVTEISGLTLVQSLAPSMACGVALTRLPFEPSSQQSGTQRKPSKVPATSTL